MLKKFYLTILIIISIFVTSLYCFAFSPYLKKGTLIKVYTRVPLTTANLEEGSRVYFISPADVWILEDKAIEKGDIFLGYVSMLKMPVLGVNAAMKINIDSLVRKNGEKRQLKGKIIFSGSDTLGGNLTNPASYNTTIHPRKVYGNPWGGTLQYVPSGEYEFGQHVRIDARDNIFVEIDEDFYI